MAHSVVQARAAPALATLNEDEELGVEVTLEHNGFRCVLTRCLCSLMMSSVVTIAVKAVLRKG